MLVTTPLSYSTTARGTPGCGMTGNSLSHHLLSPRKDNRSSAVSKASEASLLLGQHDFDFSEVMEDKCSTGKAVRMVKLTSCSLGQFTCRDGQCVSMELRCPGAGGQVPPVRCDQTSNCLDKSDEEDCQLIHMEVQSLLSVFLKSFRETTIRKFLHFNLTKSKAKLVQSTSI